MPQTPVFRAAGTVSFTPNNVATPATLTPGAPAGKTVGDVLFLVCFSKSNVATVATPTGWSVVSGFPKRSATTIGGTWYLFTRVADGTATDTPSPVWSGLVNTGATSGDSCSAVILCYTNTVTTTLDAGAIVVSDLAAQTTSSAISGMTTSSAGSLVLSLAAKIIDFSGANSSTYNERVDAATTSGVGHGLEIADTTSVSVGASGTNTVGWGTTTSARVLGVTVAFVAAALTATDADTVATDTSVTSSEFAGYVELATVSGISSVSCVDQTQTVESAIVASKTAPSGSDLYTPGAVQKETGIYRLQLASLLSPNATDPETLYVQTWKLNPTDAGILRVWVYQTTTLIETYDITLTSTDMIYSHDLTNAAAITDWSDIEVAVQGISDVGADLQPAVGWVDFDIPPAGAQVYTESATITSRSALVSSDLYDVVDSSTIAAITVASAVELVSFVDASTPTSITSASASDIAAYVDSRTVSSITTPGGTEGQTNIFTDAATPTTITSLTSTDVAAYVDSNIPSSVTTLSSSESQTTPYLDSSSISGITYIVSSDLAAYVDSNTPRGVTSLSISDLAAYIDAGTPNGSTSVISSDDITHELSDTSTISSITSITYSEVASYSDSATAETSTVLSSVESSIYVDSGLTGSITSVSATEGVFSTHTEAAEITSITYVISTESVGVLYFVDLVGYAFKRLSAEAGQRWYATATLRWAARTTRFTHDLIGNAFRRLAWTR